MTVYPLPAANAGTDPVFCEEQPAAGLVPDRGGRCLERRSNVTADGHFTPSVQGVHQLIYTVTSPQGCTNMDTVQVTVAPPAAPRMQDLTA
ncbi:MAG: hypothetical protein IPO60_14600 [Flavobacteriales bacterium]|nr:hypothetical protein [Flavobacteriales bacterium]